MKKSEELRVTKKSKMVNVNQSKYFGLPFQFTFKSLKINYLSNNILSKL